MLPNFHSPEYSTCCRRNCVPLIHFFSSRRGSQPLNVNTSQHLYASQIYLVLNFSFYNQNKANQHLKTNQCAAQAKKSEKLKEGLNLMSQVLEDALLHLLCHLLHTSVSAAAEVTDGQCPLLFCLRAGLPGQNYAVYNPS